MISRIFQRIVGELATHVPMKSIGPYNVRRTVALCDVGVEGPFSYDDNKVTCVVCKSLLQSAHENEIGSGGE